MIRVLSASPLATVQDLGRFGALNLGVGTSGAMDPMALAAGNILLGNAEDAAAIEVPIFPLSVRFEAATVFALTGADCAATLDGVAVLRWWATRAEAGQVLTLAMSQRGGRWPAARSYVCVAGGIDVPAVLGSRATQLRGSFGGFEGRPLQAGDVLHLGADARSQPGFGIRPPIFDLAYQIDDTPAVRVLPAAEFEDFTGDAQTALWSCAWKITPQSDRYGYRLAGEALTLKRPLELRSHGIVPGVIQVPHNGQPIIQMRDAQPSGGYPKIGTVIEADLWRLGQAPVGSRIRFQPCIWDEALAADDANRRWLDRLRWFVGLQGRRGVA